MAQSSISTLILFALLAGCGSTDTETNPGATPPAQVPVSYGFESRFTEDSPLAYSGQIARHVLLAGLHEQLGTMTERIDTGDWVPSTGDIVSAANFYLRFDSETSGEMPTTLNAEPGLAQTNHNAISTGKDLVGKLAGNDRTTDHLDWTEAFQGWDSDTVSTPESLVIHWVDQLDALASARAAGEIPLDPNGNAITEVFLTAEGQDLQQLITKFIGMAVFFSQGTDDYLDDDVEGKGLLSSNARVEKNGELKSYSALGHSWDEAFGYFGSARNYGDYSDDEIAGKAGRDGWANGYHDTDGDGAIDLTSEYNFGHSRNAAKRDRDASDAAATDYTRQVFDAFIAGRSLILTAGDTLTEAQLAELKSYRDQIVNGWEATIAATAVHYINEVLRDMGKFDTADYSFANHAKHWSELKGYALGFQFNPRSPLSRQDFSRLHELIGQAPALSGSANADVYRADLLEARALLAERYGFAEANMGDAHGEGGW